MDNDEKIKSKSSDTNTNAELETKGDEGTGSHKEINAEKPEDRHDPSVQGVMDEIKEIEKEIEYEQKERKSGNIPQYPRPQPQPQPQLQGPAKSSSFSSASRRPYGGIPRTYRRAQRVRRRFGPGGVSRGVGKKAGKKGAAALGRAALSNPYVLAAIGIAIAIAVGFFILIAAILHACEVHEDLGSSIDAGLTDPIGAALLFPLMLIGREVGLCESPYQIQVPPNPPGVTTEKIGEVKIENGENIPYSILKVTYDPGAPNAITLEEFNSLSLFDVPLYDFAFIEASGNYRRGSAEDGTDYIQWIFAEQTSSTSTLYEFELTLNPNETDIRAINVIYVSDTYKPIKYTSETPQEGPSTSSGSEVRACMDREKTDIWYGADCLPTNDKCGGRYPRIDETIEWLSGFPKEDPQGDGGNFGDPLCSYRLVKAERLIEELESNTSRASFWKDIVTCEGGVNSYGRQVHSTTGRPWGPAGMFQMNIGNPIFSKWTVNGSLLRGDVPWQRQIQNAIRYNNNLRAANNDFGFWGSAMCLCWWPEYRTKGYCQDIVNKGINSTTGPRAPSTNCPTGPGYLSCNTAVKCTNNTCNNIGRTGPRD